MCQSHTSSSVLNNLVALQCPHSITSTDASNNLQRRPLGTPPSTASPPRPSFSLTACSLLSFFFVEIRFSFFFPSPSLESTHTLVLLLRVYLTPNAATGLRKYVVPGGKPVLPGRKRDSGAVKRKIYACLFTATAW